MQHLVARVVAPILLASIVGGCAHVSHPATQPAEGAPLLMHGGDTHMLFDFNAHSDDVGHKLDSDELCYLIVGDALLICTRDGSFLLFGQGDGVTLVRDNPLSHLHLADRNSPSENLMQTFGAIFLLAGSIDRLPNGLVDYLNDPGPHRRQAKALVRKLLDDNGAALIGEARGGMFTVMVRFTASGREKLNDALQSEDNGDGITNVSGPSRRRR